MNYGLYLSTSGMQAAMHRMDTAANNLANTETAGFKPDLETVMAREAARPEDGLWQLPSNALLEKLGGGVLLGATRVNYSQGALEKTRNDLDVAINGEGFFRVQGPNGDVRLTRDGRMSVNAAGELVQTCTGFRVLSNAAPIRVDPTLPVHIDMRGAIDQGAGPGLRIDVVDVSDRRALRKEGAGLYRIEGDVGTVPGKGEVVQRAVERSAVDPVKAMLDISAAQRDVEYGAKMIQMADDVMNRAIGTFGRVA